MTCAASSGGCGTSSTCGGSTVYGVPFNSRRKLTAEEKKGLQKKREERAERKLQVKEHRAQVKVDTKAKLPDTSSKRAKLRLYIILLKLKINYEV
jgi:hypothetical protein